ncbi:MAG: hypothetical protein AB1792_00320 [Candidatus Zixiibacteriota bacterium]
MRPFRLCPELDVLSSLARLVPVFLGIYLAAKVIDLTLRGVWPLAFDGSLRGILFLLELALGVALPMILLAQERVRRSTTGLLASAALVVGGVVFNRINVFLVAYQPLYPVKT